jgi:DNA-binding CsgD family transcriptional regulator
VATNTHQPLPIDADTRALWERVALHLAAACRLAGRAADPEADDVEAIVDPGGRVRHARGVAEGARARQLLRDAVRQMDAARTRKGRADAMKALDLWQGLLAGRWSLVDHFDTDGRRFLLARQNDPDAPAAGTLARRQRQVAFYASVGWSLKQIGFALGLAESTVSRHLSLALDKLGMRSRSDLVRVTSEMARAAATRMLSPPA